MRALNGKTRYKRKKFRSELKEKVKLGLTIFTDI